MNISFIDASNAGKEMDDKNGGVGLARKIGMDLALTKFDYNSSGKRILICTDADCKVDLNYLSEISREFNKNILEILFFLKINILFFLLNCRLEKG